MYSTTSSSNDSDYVIEDTSSEESSADEMDLFLEGCIESREAAEHKLSSAFWCLFESEDGPFRSLFPMEFAPESEVLPDFSELLQDGGWMCEETHSDTELEGEEHCESYVEETNESEEPLKLLNDAETVGITTSRWKPTPATKFMDKNPTCSLLLKISLETNRSELKERHHDEFPGIDFFVGYIDKEPMGWALVKSTDVKVIRAMQSYYPYHRFATKDDYIMFSREKRPGSVGIIPTIQPPLPRRDRKKNKTYGRRRRSVDALSSYIDARGGLGKAVFVCFDIEAAIVHRNCVPQPLEIALVPCGSNHSLTHYHCFIHPGKVVDNETALKLSCGFVPGSHYIPFQGASFLRRDYANIANDLRSFLSYECVVFVNKDSLMDAQGLRWVFAAACEVGNAEMDIPSLEDIPCFDIETVKELLVGSGSSTRENITKTNFEAPCWYHDKMHKELKNVLVTYEGCHCALKDAMNLRNEIEKYLKPLQQQATD
uniref:Uncharacterized protein n=1 Tax=Trypanosoma congolense (strain IL3000) TaxID=1068625 RepID=G0UX73_TRYCI|nr:conserved hypothetical protein [Trypanosoma congolense IL3000]